jgi:hypothetical protein
VDAALGSRKNPMRWDHVVRKAHAVLDDDFTADLVDGMLAWADGLDSADSIRGIGRFLSHPGRGRKGGH